MASAEHTLGLPQPGEASRPSPGARIDPRCRYPKHGTAQAPCFDRGGVRAGDPRLVVRRRQPARRCRRTHLVRPAGVGLLPAGTRRGTGRDDVGSQPGGRRDRAGRSRRIVVVDPPRVRRRSLRHRPRVRRGDVVHRAQREPDRAAHDGRGALRVLSPRPVDADGHHARPRRRALVRAARRQRDRPHHAGRSDHRMANDHPSSRAAQRDDGIRRGDVVHPDGRQRDRTDHARRHDDGVPPPRERERPAVDHHRSGRRAVVHGSRVQHDRADDDRRRRDDLPGPHAGSRCERDHDGGSTAPSGSRRAPPTPSAGSSLDGAIVEIPLGEGATPTGITTGADGAIWFSAQGTNRVGRLEPSGPADRRRSDRHDRVAGTRLGADRRRGHGRRLLLHG